MTMDEVYLKLNDEDLVRKLKVRIRHPSYNEVVSLVDMHLENDDTIVFDTSVIYDVPEHNNECTSLGERG